MKEYMTLRLVIKQLEKEPRFNSEGIYAILLCNGEKQIQNNLGSNS